MSDINELLEIMGRLRDPDNGCPWDLEQDFSSIAPYTIEEAYEVADAIQRGDPADLMDELGDLLFQVAFHAQMASEQGLFNFEDVVRSISTKMVRRHPHVFGDGEIKDAQAQTRAWEEHKAQERSLKNPDGAGEGLLEDIPVALPALVRARKLGKRAAQVGFDWADAEGVRAKVSEELQELDDELTAKDAEGAEEELGDLLFALANLGRHLGLDAEQALSRANRKFLMRFRFIEQSLSAQRRSLGEASLEEMEALWHASKKALQK